MESIMDSLNYDFNVLLHNFETSLHDRLSNSDKRLAVSWVNKLKMESNSLEEAHLRNDLLFYLVESVATGCLRPPFHEKPPNGKLLTIRSILPPEMKAQLKNQPKYPRAEIFERSPDKGAFLASQPVPRSGAFCYLAIVSNKK